MLDGLRVVDLTRFVSGAYASFILATLGAEVLKIEGPAGGDPYRNQGTARVGDESVLFMTLNSAKKSVALDFRAEDARPAIDALLASADVLLENGRPGSLAKYGLDYPSVHARFPSLVYGSVSGFGDVGPDAGRGGFDLILQASGGLMSVTGHQATGPAKIGVPVTDIGAGLACVVGVLAALSERERTGLGRQVSTSLLEFSLAALATVATAYLVNGELPGLLGSHSPTFAPYGAFRARDGHFVAAGAGSEALWRRFCETLGAAHLIEDPRFADNASRVAARDELTAEIESITSRKDVAEWLALFAEAQVPADRINDIGGVLDGSQARALGSVQTLMHDAAGAYPAIGLPLRIDREPLPIPRPAPLLGQHTRESLLQAGMEPAYVDALIAGGTAAEPT